MSVHSSLNDEKLAPLRASGNVLVTANPGTGKTMLLAHRFVYLVQQGVSVEDILCLTFTRKAREEMESRITNLLNEAGISYSSSDLNIHSFHSYAHNFLDDEGVASTNALRHVIYTYLTDEEVFNYPDDYLINRVVPQVERMISYLKSFAITPDTITEDAINFLPQDHKRLEELEAFFPHFIKIFEHYEQQKRLIGRDYNDLLLDILEHLDEPQFAHVLVDELQDVNKVQAEIAKKVAKTFFAVGDKKQAIFAFQGGSILNFSLFSDSEQFVLSDNYRSSQEILDYTKEYYLQQTDDEEITNLKSAEDMHGSKPLLAEADNELEAIAALAKKYEELTVITRNNKQILDISQTLKNHSIPHSATYFSSSEQAKTHIIDFLKGVVSEDPGDMKKALTTPFAPTKLQTVFSLSRRASAQEVLQAAPKFKQLREELRSLQDIDAFFYEKILPVAVAYGKDYFYAALSVQKAALEAAKLPPEEFFNYLQAAAIITDENFEEQPVNLTTVHKAKGKQFTRVVYLPKKSTNRTWLDEISPAILRSKDIQPEEEAQNEDLRIDFVALTRAKEELIILSDKTEYLNDYAQKTSLEELTPQKAQATEQALKAYSLFVNEQFEQAKQELNNDNPWLIPALTNQLQAINRLSYSLLTNDAWKFLTEKLFGIQSTSQALALGSEVHQIAEDLLQEKQPTITKDTQPYADNIQAILKQLPKEVISTEEQFSISSQELFGIGDLPVTGKIDAVLKEEDTYLLVDWKTSKNTNYASSHRRQLAMYKKAYSKKHDIPEDNIQVAIAYIGLRKTINDGTINYELDQRQPRKSALNTLKKRVQAILEWKENPQTLLEEIAAKEQDDALWKQLVQQYEKEANE